MQAIMVSLAWHVPCGRLGGCAAAAAAGCAAGDAAGAGGVVASPAPLTIGKAGPRSRLKGGAPDENQAPGAAAPGTQGLVVVV